MRIISKFSDYYDRALALGHESDRVYVRHTKEIDTSKKDTDPKIMELAEKANEHSPSPVRLRINSHRYLRLEPLKYCIGGLTYSAMWLRVEQWDHKYPSPIQYTPATEYINRKKRYDSVIPMPETLVDESSTTHQFIQSTYAKSCNAAPYGINSEGLTWEINRPVFNVEELAELLPEEDYKILEKKRTWSWEKRNSNNRYLKELEQWFEQNNDKLYTLLQDQQIVTAIISDHSVVLNPSLRNYHFFQRLDPSQVMQELSMFVGNIAHPDTVPLVLDDRYRIQAHGFNDASFRKQPTKKGLPKRRKRPHPDNVVPSDDPSPN